MSNIFKRAFSYLTGSGTKEVLVSNRSEYVEQRRQNISTGGKFDFTQPELCSTVFACVQLISNNISKLRLNVYRTTDKGREVFVKHPWQRSLAYNPDLRLSTAKWLAYTVTKLLIEGGAYFLRTEFDENFNPKNELKALPELEKVSKLGDEIYYKFKGIDGWIPSRRLVFVYLFSRDGITPISPIQALKTELEIQHHSEQVLKNFYSNGIFQLLYVEADLDLATDKQKAKEYFQKVEAEVMGSANAYNQIFRVPPMYKLKALPLPTDLKWLESSRFSEARIAGLYNVPNFYLNINEGSAPAGKIENQAISFLNNCLSNITNIILAELNDKLLTIEERESGVTIDFDYESLFTTDLESKSMYLKNLASTGGITPNEIRQKLGMPKDGSPFMDMNFIQSQNMPIQYWDKWANNKAPVQGQQQGNNNTEE